MLLVPNEEAAHQQRTVSVHPISGTAHQRPIFCHIPGTQYDVGQINAIMSHNVVSYVMRPLSVIRRS